MALHRSGAQLGHAMAKAGGGQGAIGLQANAPVTRGVGIRKGFHFDFSFNVVWLFLINAAKVQNNIEKSKFPAKNLLKNAHKTENLLQDNMLLTNKLLLLAVDSVDCFKLFSRAHTLA
jgi:hypothetical protein